MPGIVPGPDTAFLKQLTALEAAVQKLSTRDVLQNASIGAGGIICQGTITITDGGSIVVQGTGAIMLPTGTFTAGIVNGTTVNATTLVVSGDAGISGVLNVNGSIASTAGNVTAAGQVVSAGIINSPGTKANTVTVGYSAVYIDATGNMGGNTSSERHKTNITDAEYDLDGLLALRPREFQRHTDVLEMGLGAPWQRGLFAEEAEKVVPHHVWHDEDGRVEGIRYEELVVPLIAAVARERRERLADREAFEERLRKLEER